MGAHVTGLFDAIPQPVEADELAILAALGLDLTAEVAGAGIEARFTRKTLAPPA